MNATSIAFQRNSSNVFPNKALPIRLSHDVSRKDVETTLDKLDKLVDPDMVNLLRAEFKRLWRMAEVSADVDVLYCAPDTPSESGHTKGNE